MANARLAVVTVPDFKVQILLPGVLHPQLPAPVHGAVAAVGVDRQFREVDLCGVKVEGTAVEPHFGPVVDPFQGALVRQADAICIRLTDDMTCAPKVSYSWLAGGFLSAVPGGKSMRPPPVIFRG